MSRFHHSGQTGAYGWSPRRWRFHLWIGGLFGILDGLIAVVTLGRYTGSFLLDYTCRTALKGLRTNGRTRPPAN